MPATDHLQIYDFETAIEAAFETLFVAQEINTLKPGDSEFYNARPRAEVLVMVGRQTGSIWTGDITYQRPQAFEGSISVRVITSAKEDDASISEHAQYRSAVRNVMVKSRQLLNADTLPEFHQLLDVIQTGTSYEYNPQEGVLVSQLTYDIRFCIRQTAWPTE